MEKLGDVCVVSLQCPKGQDCHPLSKTCACPLYQPNCDQPVTITSTMASTTGIMVFENQRKCLIEHCERSELRLHFEWTKMPKKVYFVSKFTSKIK